SHGHAHPPIYTLSLHDALPISHRKAFRNARPTYRDHGFAFAQVRVGSNVFHIPADMSTHARPLELFGSLIGVACRKPGLHLCIQCCAMLDASLHTSKARVVVAYA